MASAACAEPPDYDSLPVVGGLRSSWGLWGEDDVLGCLNLLTPSRVATAARGVRRGAVFSLNWRVDRPRPALFGRPVLRHDIVQSAASTNLNDVLHDWNPQSSSQWDGFRHVPRHEYRHYNGLADTEHGVHWWAERGIAGNAVLLDVARWRASVGRPLRHGTPDPIDATDLRATADAQGVQIETGDILLLHTGWVDWYEGLDDEQRVTTAPLGSPGLRPDEEMARTLWNLHVAAVAADNPALELTPVGALLPAAEADAVRADPSRRHEMSLHVRLIPMLGLPIGELWRLGELAADCASDGVYRFCLMSAPLNLPFGTSSPANALAVK